MCVASRTPVSLRAPAPTRSETVHGEPCFTETTRLPSWTRAPAASAAVGYPAREGGGVESDLTAEASGGPHVEGEIGLVGELDLEARGLSRLRLGLDLRRAALFLGVNEFGAVSRAHSISWS